MPSEVPEETHLDSDGLYIPHPLREFDRQVVIRTPRMTHQFFSSDGELPAYYGMVDEGEFGDPSKFREAKNPDLAPDRVSIKPEGEEAVVLTVDLDPGIRPDGGTTPDDRDHPGWICTGCGKVISSQPVSDCHDCGSTFRRATAEDLACDVCGEPDANKVFGEATRLCDRHLEQVQYHEQYYGAGRTLDELPHDESLTGPPERLAFEYEPGDCLRLIGTEDPVYVVQRRLWDYDGAVEDPYWPDVDYQKTYRVGEVAGLGHPTKLLTEADIHEQYELVSEAQAKAIAFDDPDAFNWGESDGE